MDTCIIDTIIMDTSAWVTRLERLKGAKDKVMEVEGPQIRSWGPEGPPKLLFHHNGGDTQQKVFCL